MLEQIRLTDFVCSGRGATTGGRVSSSSSSSPSLPPDGEVTVPCLPSCNGTQKKLRECAWILHMFLMNWSTHRLRVFIWKNKARKVSPCGNNCGFLFLRQCERKLTWGRKAEVFLFPAGGVVELEDVKDSLRILFLLWFADVGRLKETGPLFWHALDTKKEYRMSEQCTLRLIWSQRICAKVCFGSLSDLLMYVCMCVDLLICNRF